MSKRRTIEFAVGLVLLSVLVGAAAGWAKGPKPAGPPPDAVLTWNTYAVNADFVRRRRPRSRRTAWSTCRTSRLRSMTPSRNSRGATSRITTSRLLLDQNASVQAAVAAAARTTLNNYLPDQQPTVDAEYNTYLAGLTGNVAGGVALGEAAAQDLIAFRAGDGLKAATPAYGGIGPILPGQWQLQPGQAVQTPWFATMRPFLLDQASQFRADPPPALTSHQYAKDLNETEAYGALNSIVRTPEQTGDRVLLGGEQHQPVQPDDAERRGAARHGPRRRRAPARRRRDRDHGRRDGVLRLEVLLSRLAPDHGDQERRQGRQSRHDRRPGVAIGATRAGASRVPVAARLFHRRVQRRARVGAAHEPHRCHDGWWRRTAAPS